MENELIMNCIQCGKTIVGEPVDDDFCSNLCMDTWETENRSPIDEYDDYDYDEDWEDDEDDDYDYDDDDDEDWDD